ncbi:hypothetical protein NYR68_01875 [Actinobacillus equuli subsp. haemolyticus]|uniref:hypothetical protein n=1 Tax=Actinobacillus equuli TaxID=718 RepID=UPI0024466653|nr:hypothetical protein [Actinobacillus equuli]WGE51162.1 hypothetical protein NYR68_01875 [Actinobacillus equuli subsp. haemolyticus]
MDQQWLNATLGKGVAMLLILRLKNSPPEDSISATLETWLRVLTYKKHYEQELDQWRFEEAFMYLAQTCDWFPNPKQLLDAMPKRKIKELPPPPPKTVEQEEAERLKALRNLQKIKAMLRGCYAK